MHFTSSIIKRETSVNSICFFEKFEVKQNSKVILDFRDSDIFRILINLTVTKPMKDEIYITQKYPYEIKK